MKRDDNFIYNLLVETPEGPVKTKARMAIHVPYRFQEKGLLRQGDRIYVMGSFGLVSGTTYSSFNTNAMVEIRIDETNVITINDEKYFELVVYPNTVIFPTLVALKDGLVMDVIMNMYLFRGQVPWYMSEEDMVFFLDTATKHSGLRLDKIPVVMEVLVSLATRMKSNTDIFSRMAKKPLTKDEITYVPLANVSFGSNTPFNKITGGYQSAGLISSLITTAEETSTTEEIIRT